jgi:hypothetical protein
MKLLKPILFLLIIGVLVSCAKPDIATPAPTPEAIQVFYPPTMKFWANSLANCASNNPQVALYFFPSFSSRDIIENNTIILNLGQATQGMGNIFISQIGWDKLAVVVNVSNKTPQLSQEEIQRIFSGQVSNWGEGQKLPIQVWVLPEDDPYNLIFNTAFLSNHNLTSEAHLAPDADAMIEAISQNPGGVGYLPESILTSNDTSQIENLKIIPITTSLKSELRQPVVVITQTEPKGWTRQLLVCLQNTDN